MKKILYILLSLFFLAACQGGSADLTGTSKPRIPQKRPSIPSGKILQANVLGTLNPTSDELDMKRLLNTIDNNIRQPNISIIDIERGWYYGRKDEKKTGTPSSWVWIDKGDQSVWSSPNTTDETDDVALDKLCESTAGSYAFSCVEREIATCEHIPKSLCRCSEGTRWVDEQGCILLNRNDEFVAVTTDDLKQGWYFGLPNEKRLYTPRNWLWLENGKQSRWQAPNPLNRD